MEHTWTNSIWDCFTPFDTCLLGTCCPCFLFGRTQARIKGETDPSGFNLECCAWFCLLQCYAAECLQAVKRSDMRAKYRLEGSCISDWALSCCCTCCALIQEEKESLLKEHNEKQAYVPPQGMTYGNPQPQHPRQHQQGYSNGSRHGQYPQQPQQIHAAAPAALGHDQQYYHQATQGYPAEK